MFKVFLFFYDFKKLTRKLKNNQKYKEKKIYMEKFIFLNIRRKREDIAHMCVKYNLRLIDVAIAWKFFKKNIISPSNMLENINRINDYKWTLLRRIKFRLDLCIRQSLSIIDIIVARSINVIVTSHNVPPCSRHFPPFPAIYCQFLSFFYLSRFCIAKLSSRKLLNYRVIMRRK